VRSVQQLAPSRRRRCCTRPIALAPSIIEAGLQAARRVNDYGTAARIFEGIKETVENKVQDGAYQAELKNRKDELGGSERACGLLYP